MNSRRTRVGRKFAAILVLVGVGCDFSRADEATGVGGDDACDTLEVELAVPPVITTAPIDLRGTAHQKGGKAIQAVVVGTRSATSDDFDFRTFSVTLQRADLEALPSVSTCAAAAGGSAGTSSAGSPSSGGVGASPGNGGMAGDASAGTAAEDAGAAGAPPAGAGGTPTTTGGTAGTATGGAAPSGGASCGPRRVAFPIQAVTAAGKACALGAKQTAELSLPPSSTGAGGSGTGSGGTSAGGVTSTGGSGQGGAAAGGVSPQAGTTSEAGKPSTGGVAATGGSGGASSSGGMAGNASGAGGVGESGQGGAP